MRSDAGSVELVRHAPAGLSELVAGVVGLRERSRVAVDRRQPAGSLTLVRLSLGDRLTVTDLAAGEGGGRSYGSFVAGFMPGHAGTRYPSGQDCIQIYLTPRGVHRLLGMPSGELAGRLTDLDEVAPRFGDDLLNRLAEADWPARFALVDAALRQLAADGPDHDADADRLWQRIGVSAGRIRLGDLVGESGWSHRRFISRLRAHVGVTPKAAAGVLRFEHAVDALSRAGDAEGLADLAVRLGYADQSHLTREVVRYAGATPAAIRRAPVPTAWTALGRRPGRQVGDHILPT